jgi:hypothetical protein
LFYLTHLEAVGLSNSGLHLKIHSCGHLTLLFLVGALLLFGFFAHVFIIILDSFRLKHFVDFEVLPFGPVKLKVWANLVFKQGRLEPVLQSFVEWLLVKFVFKHFTDERPETLCQPGAEFRRRKAFFNFCYFAHELRVSVLKAAQPRDFAVYEEGKQVRERNQVVASGLGNLAKHVFACKQNVANERHRALLSYVLSIPKVLFRNSVVN